MVSKVVFLVAAFIFIDMACSRNLLKYSELDEEDHQLLRAAYDTPSYHEEYQEDDDMKLGKVDLLKDGLWALKAKVKELKAFDKALVANLLSTKLKMKDLLENHLGALKKHHHPEPASYSYHAPSYQTPHYSAPIPQYSSAATYQHSSPSAYAPSVSHYASSHQYGGSSNQYGTSGSQYGTSGSQYGTSGSQYGNSGSLHGAGNQYGSAANQYSSGNQISEDQYSNSVNQHGNSQPASSSSHDPYYGN